MKAVRYSQLGGPEVVEPLPLCHQHVQRPTVLAAEHAREAELMQLDALQHFAAIDDAHDTRSSIRERGRPDGAVGVQAHAVAALAQFGKDPPVRKCPVLGDIESGQPRLE
jgi:hypothetical protein